MHVHIVGNGLRGSGCWLKVGTWHRPLAAFMLRHIGVGVSTRAPEFDEAYARHLAKLVRESSLGAAVILAQDEVYDALPDDSLPGKGPGHGGGNFVITRIAATLTPPQSATPIPPYFAACPSC